MYSTFRRLDFFLLVLNGIVVIQILWWVVFFYRVMDDYRSLLHDQETLIHGLVSNREVAGISLDMYVLSAREKEKQLLRYENMILWEGSFFLAVMGIFTFFVIKNYLIQKKFFDEKLLLLNSFTHELKTPITAIKLNLQTIKKNKNDNTYGDLLEDTLKQIESLNQKISMILFDRELRLFEEKKIHRVNPYALLQTILRDLEGYILQKNASFAVKNRIKEESIYLKIPPQWLYFVFKEMIWNSLKYSDEGVRIEVSFELKKTLFRNHFTVIFRDTGWGVPERVKSKVFLPYTRFHNSPGIEGTGLGLYYVKEIVSKAKGSIGLQPLPQGVEFSITFPSYENET